MLYPIHWQQILSISTISKFDEITEMKLKKIVLESHYQLLSWKYADQSARQAFDGIQKSSNLSSYL
jgi:hypothetical protein